MPVRTVFGSPCNDILKKTPEHVSCEFDKFRVDNNLCKLRDMPAARLSYIPPWYFCIRTRALKIHPSVDFFPLFEKNLFQKVDKYKYIEI